MTEPYQEGSVRGIIHHARSFAGTGIVLAHGAGSNCHARLLVGLAEAFSRAGLMVLRIDLPFRQARPAGPPPRGSGDKDREGLREAVRVLQKLGCGQVVLGGHSYGGRQATMLAAEEPSIANRLLLLSYPLHPPRNPAQLRTEHFPKIQVACTFVHGARDPFGSVEEMREAVSLIPAPVDLVIIEGAGHELKPVVSTPASVAGRIFSQLPSVGAST